MSEKIAQLNEEIIKGQIKEMVRGSVEETLNELLEKEAESLTQAARYERSEARQGYRSGHYDRPPVNEDMLRSMMMSMGQKPSEKKIRQYQTASCIPSGYRNRTDWSLYLDGTALFPCWRIFT